MKPSEPSGYFDVYQGTDGTPSFIQIKPELADKTSVKLYTLPDINIEVDAWKHLSVTAIAAENPSVAEYVKELESRAAAAYDLLRECRAMLDGLEAQRLIYRINAAMGEKK